MVKVEMDLARDRFTVVTENGEPTTAELIAEIAELGFVATRVDESAAPGEKEPAPPAEGAAEAVPELVEKALKRAKRKRRSVLFEFSAEWCAPCQQMQEKTYGDPQVAEQLKRDFVHVHVDTDEHPDVARWFGVTAIPDARILDSSGEELRRVQGYKSAEEMMGILDPSSRAGDLGLSVHPLTREQARELNLPTGEVRVRGLFVHEIEEGGPAEAAGIQEDDIILELGGSRLYSVDNVRDFLRVTPPDSEIEIKFRRGKDTEVRKAKLTLGTGAPKPEGIDWQFASLEQLEDALAAARKGKRSVLVGISGAET